MTCVIVDYGSGNLHSAQKSFQRMAKDAATVVVSARPEDVAAADRIVLPGVGAFADCRAGLMAIDGLFDAIEEAVTRRAVPFLGICVGMQMMAARGLEHGVETPGFDWIGGDVRQIEPNDPALKIPHMGWNTLKFRADHALREGLSDGDHAYFVHSYHVAGADKAQLLATADHGGPVTAMVVQDNIAGTQFHPEKSQALGLRLIDNFLNWTP